MNGRAILGVSLFSSVCVLQRNELTTSHRGDWEKFQSLATKWHPNKAEMNRLCALVEDKCLNHFKNILKKRDQSTLDRLFTSPLAKRQRPATEDLP